jgi:hypothetical protein
LLKHDTLVELFNVVLALAERNGCLVWERFSADGTPIRA